MDPITLVTALNSALSIVQALLPEVERLFKSGQITIEDQTALLSKIDSIRSGAAFEGPEWEKS